MDTYGRRMRGLSVKMANIPWQQRAIRNKCFHPTGTFVEFSRDEMVLEALSDEEANQLLAEETISSNPIGRYI